MINKDHLFVLKSILNPQKLNLLIDVYEKDSQRLLQECKTALRAENWVHLTESAHGLKGISANMGAVDFQELSKDLEEAGKANDRISCLNILGILSEKYDTMIKELREFACE